MKNDMNETTYKAIRLVEDLQEIINAIDKQKHPPNGGN